MNSAYKLEVKQMNRKRIAVSKKRQITIPIEFYNSIGIDKEVECYVQNGSIIINPVNEVSGEFDEEILADLISQGLSGEELLEEFKKTRHKVKPAVEGMLEDAKLAAEGKIESYSYDDIFCAEDSDV